MCHTSSSRRITELSKWSRVLLEKMTVAQLVKKLLSFYGHLTFIAVFTRARHWSLSLPIYPIYFSFILILSSQLHLGLPSAFFPSGFPTKILYLFHIFPICIRPTYPTHLCPDFMKVIFGKV
jgi:hypothetical protein